VAVSRSQYLKTTVAGGVDDYDAVRRESACAEIIAITF
jgi:hypothetical protein